MAGYGLTESRLTQAMTQRGITHMQAIRRVTETAIAEVSVVHRCAIRAASTTLTEAQQIQRMAGKPLNEPAFQDLTVDYLDALTRITEAAGVDMLRVIDQALR